MFVAAMIDLGLDQQMLQDTLSTLPLSDYRIRISRVTKHTL
ncbi:MAG: DUF111 family protein, partial [Lachnospiraceae bacterium]|nr:DUF111 family protein [Lachnospiraceae bacterium]